MTDLNVAPNVREDDKQQVDVIPHEGLVEALAIIARDSQATPQSYLKETEVPHGGE